MEGWIASRENGGFVAKPSVHPRVLFGLRIAGIQGVPETAVLHMQLIWCYADDGSYTAMRPASASSVLFGWEEANLTIFLV